MSDNNFLIKPSVLSFAVAQEINILKAQAYQASDDSQASQASHAHQASQAYQAPYLLENARSLQLLPHNQETNDGYCGTKMQGQVHKTAYCDYYCSSIKQGHDPFFNLPLWFLSSFNGKLVWALNREHLNYLIDYLSATLREKPTTYPLKTQSDHLPTFMKTAKNRERIVKILRKMQQDLLV